MTTAPAYKRKNGYATQEPPNAAVDAHAAALSMLPPQAPALEEAVVGAMLIDRTALPIVVDILQPESFYSTALGKIYKACLAIWGRQEAVDILTATEELRRTRELESVGGASYLIDITNRIGSAANTEYHARIVAQKAMQRRAIEGCNGFIRQAYAPDADAFTLIEQVQEWAFGLSNVSGRQVMSVDSILPGVMADIAAAMGKPGGVTGISSGLSAIDRETTGWQPSDLIIIAGRPGMGKTALAMFLAVQAAKVGKGVMFFALEMSKEQMAQRIISCEAGVSTTQMRSGCISEDDLRRMDDASRTIARLPLYIDDTPGITVGEIRAKARRQAASAVGLGLVVVDYIQLMSGGDDERSGQRNREQEVSAFSRGLKGLAKELGVPVIALSQLSRAVELRAEKRPMLSDLRESGALEQDADLVAFCYRPEYYKIEKYDDGRSTNGVFEFIIAKHRHGAPENVGVRFSPAFGRFSDFDDPAFADTTPTYSPALPQGVRPPADADIPF